MLSRSVPFLQRALLLLAFASLCSTGLRAERWIVLGPDGGDVRSLTYDPRDPDQIYLGTSTGSIFISRDAGRHWAYFAHIGGGNDYVLDHIAVDPANSARIYAAAWSVEDQRSGDLFRSGDAGKTWQALPAMHDKSIRALTLAPSDSQVLVVGALDGVFRSKDGGDTWRRISPAGHEGIKNVESIAVDPKNPDVVYAGTWHLAWKTADAGENWTHINKGMIEDSDVFSIIVDASNPFVVFASACSGIYKSMTSGELFQKIQGIPFSARRTRVLRQDPNHPEVVYAGTTEGLWKTGDSGKTWRRVTGAATVVNDVLVDPRNSSRVLLATDRGGVLASDDGAMTFTASNRGYSHRYVTSLVADSRDPDSIFAGIVNDRELGGVYHSPDAGQHWSQKSLGLGERDVFTLKQASSGAIVAGTNRGIFILEPKAAAWRPSNSVVDETTTYRAVRKGKKTTRVPVKKIKKSVLEARVNDLELGSDHWLAATTAGLYVSRDQGKSWSGGPILAEKEFVAARYSGDVVVAATRTDLIVSKDAGLTWMQPTLATIKLNIRGVTIAPEGQIILATREGIYRSTDTGKTWERMLGALPDREFTSILFDPVSQRLLATSYVSTVVWESADGGATWKRGPDTGHPLRRIAIVRGRYFAATPFDGVIMQPETDAPPASVAASSP